MSDREPAHISHNAPPVKRRRASAKQRRRQRDILVWRNGPFCHLCGGLIVRGTVTLDHRKPKANGGNNNLNNMALAHKPCNEKRGAPKRWRQVARCTEEPAGQRVLDTGPPLTAFW